MRFDKYQYMSHRLFAYGSLMEMDEIQTLFGDDVDIYRAKLEGYVRDYSKIAHSWGPKNEATGVLGIQKARDEWCNGIIIDGITETGIENYYLRELGVTPEKYEHGEFGYNIVDIDSDRFEFYGGRPNISGPTITAITNSRLAEPNIHEPYAKMCKNAAKEHGEVFYEDFEESTYDYYDSN